MSRRADARSRILQAAAQLFYQQGYRAVGIDTIIAASGVAKMSLYRHFASKDDLIAAYLEEANQGFWHWINTLAAPHQGDPRQELEAVFDGIADYASKAQCLGCAFMGASAEFPEQDHPGHQAALQHKAEVLAYLLARAQAAGAQEPALLADGLFLLMDGTWAAVRMFGPGNSHTAGLGKLARALLDSQLPATSSA